MIEIRPCRLEECSQVLALWERAGAIASPTDTLDEVTRLVREHAGLSSSPSRRAPSSGA